MPKFFQKAALPCLPVAFAALYLPFVRSPWFAADDGLELAFVRGAESFGTLLGTDAFGLFRPVKNLLFALFSTLYAHGGIVPCRLLAIAVGAASLFPVWALMKRIFDKRTSALMAAGIWLLAPTLASQVVWLSCLNIQVMVALVALAVVFHDSRKPVLCAGTVFLSCVSYECAVAAGPLILAFDYFMRPERLADRRGWWRLALTFGAIAAFLALRGALGAVSAVNGNLANVSRAGLAAASAYFTCEHFLSWLWPFGRFAILGGYAEGTVSRGVLILCWAALAFAAAVALGVRRRRPQLGLGIACALIGFLPVSNLTGVGNGPYGDYYLALPSIGLSVTLTALAELHRLAGPVLVGLRLLLVPETVHWAALWSDADRGFVVSAENFPRFFGNHIYLARRCADLGAYDLAFKYGDRVEKAVGAESGQMGSIHLMRALHALNVEKNATKALDLLEKSRRNSDFSDKPYNRDFYRGCVYEDLLNDTAAAEKAYRSALGGRWAFDSVQPADRLARLLALRGETEAAIALWEKALRLDPDNAGIRHNLTVARADRDRLPRGKRPATTLSPMQTP